MTEDQIRLVNEIMGGGQRLDTGVYGGVKYSLPSSEVSIPASISQVPSIGGLSSVQQKMRGILRQREEEAEQARQADLASRSLGEKTLGAGQAAAFLGKEVAKAGAYPFAALYGQITGQPEIGESLLRMGDLPKSELGLEYTARVGEGLEPVIAAIDQSKAPHLIPGAVTFPAQVIGSAATQAGLATQRAAEAAKRAADRIPFRSDLLPLYASPQFVTRAADKAKDVVKDVTQAVKSELEVAPVGAVQLQTPTAPVSDINFYSPARQATLNLKQEKGTGNQMLAQISKTPGVKPAELEWTGLADFLKSKGDQPVTKTEINNYLRNNQVRVSEKIMVSPEARNDIINDALPYNYSRDIEGSFYDNIAERYIPFNYLPEDVQDNVRMVMDKLGDAEYGRDDLVLPGGENYREILLTLPEKKSPYGKFLDYVNQKYGKNTPRSQWSDEDNTNYERLVIQQAAAGDPNFKSSHYFEPNVISHMRVNDRFDANGKKVLFVEELQSDWGQRGKSEGFQFPEELVTKNAKLADLQARFDKSIEQFEKAKVRFENSTPSDNVVELLTDMRRAAGETDLLRQEMDKINKGGLPSAPFVSTHQYQVMKDGKPLITKNKENKDVPHIYDSPEDAQRAAEKFGGTVEDIWNAR